MNVRMIGHSTVTIEAGGCTLLTDPWFALHGNLAYARRAAPAVSAEALRNVDLVLVSHNHWDHVDRGFLRSLPASVPVLAPAATARLIHWLGAAHVVPLRAWMTHVHGGVRITAVPALHLVPAIGFVVEADGKACYFAGDTYARPFMAEIGRRFALDAALMPVTTFRLPMTMGESGAVAATRALRPTRIIPIHLGIQPRVPWLRTRQSPEGFRRRLDAAGVQAIVTVLKPGDQCQL